MFDSNNFSDWVMCNDGASQSFKEYIYPSLLIPDEADGRPGSPLLPSTSAHSTCKALPVLMEM